MSESNNKTPLRALIIFIICLIITIVLYFKNGLGIDSVAFGIAALVSLVALILSLKKNA